MKSKVTTTLRATAWLALCLALSAAATRAQQPTPQPSASQQKSADDKTKSSAPKAGDAAGDYTVTSSIELGYRGLRVGGDINKYQSDLNYKAGVRLFDTSFLLKAKEGKKGGLFDTLLVTSTGWGADPYGHVRISAENSKWYRFDGQYRRFRYFNFLNNIANPNFATQPTNPATGEHGYDTRQQLGDFDLTILPKNEKIRFNVGFSPERYSGPAFTTYHVGGDDFMLLSNLRSRSNDFRVGADWKLGPVNFSLLQGFRRFREDSSVANNYLNLGQYSINGNTKRPNTLGDFGVTYMATDKLRISNTFRVETFQINGGDFYTARFNVTRANGTVLAPIIVNNGGNPFIFNEVTKYRKIQDTVEGDYQFNDRYAAHFGYRYGTRRIDEFQNGFGLNANLPAALVPTADEETNHTNAFFGGFKARPVKEWTVYFDAEHGTADNVFTRVGNYNYTNLRARSRYAPTHKLSLNFSVITRNNSNPSEIGGVSLADFGVNVKSRVFNSSVDWTANERLSFSAGYTHNRVDSDAVVDFFFNAVEHPTGHSLYFMRNHFFYLDTVAHLLPRVTLYAAYRINKDTGQGNRLADPTGTPGFLVTSYPMSFQSPEGRLSIRVNHRLDWNVGYQYYNYNESGLLRYNIGAYIVSVRPQNYHAHMPYTSLRIYFGGGER